MIDREMITLRAMPTCRMQSGLRQGLAPGRLPNYKLRLEDALQERSAGVLHGRLQTLPGQGTHLVDGLLNSRQGAGEILCLLDPVAADQGDVRPGAQSQIAERPIGADGHIVVVTEDRVELRSARKAFAHTAPGRC